MKNKILIIFPSSMDLGGIERSLLGLLGVIDYNKYEVDLFLYSHHGALFSQLPSKLNLLPEVNELAYLRESLMTKLKHRAFYSVWRRIIDGIQNAEPDLSWKKTMLRCTRMLVQKYDLAIGFFLPFDFLYERVYAIKKIGWIHTDYSSISEISIHMLKSQYLHLDKIVAVSGACAESFIKTMPDLANKVITMENILPKKLILNQTEEFIPKEFDSIDDVIKILSIGRFCNAKNFDNVPEICAGLLAKGLNVKWYLIGYGGEEELIRKKIAVFKMEEHVIILGKKDNPYPYIKACDVYIQPSRYEGKCVAVREAQMLGKPVIITNYATSASQLEDGVDGIIVPLEMNSCINGIAKVLHDKKLQKNLIYNCKQRDYSNAAEIEKLYELLQ